MKRVILCILACVLLLMWTGVHAENCLHEHQQVIGVLNECKDFETGHAIVVTKNCICADCGKKVVRMEYEEFEGHAFHMSESIHFEEDSMHLWVFICPECWHISLIEEACTGGAQCMLYSAQEGELPPIQYGQFVSDMWELTAQDYVKRWLVR